MKTRAALAFVAFLLSAAAGQAQAFKDLPGVAPSDATDEYKSHGVPVCKQAVDVPRSSASDWRPRNVYVCEQENGMSASGTALPPSSIRALRGLGY